MQIHLSEHFTYRKLLRFTFPTIVMLIFTSIYGVVDGVFVSNYAGKTAFAAVNLIMPALMIFATVGFMLGTGGSAVVARTMGEGNLSQANRYFSLIVYTGIAAGAALTVLAELIMEPLCILLGADGAMLGQAILYGRILSLALVPLILQNMFQSFLVAAERPKLGLALTVAAGLTNIVGDWLLVGVLPWGVAGAAIATVASSFVSGMVPLVYFLLPNKSPLRLTKTRLESRVLGQTCSNGSSEMTSNLSTSLVSILYNFQLMHLIGEDGAAAVPYLRGLRHGSAGPHHPGLPAVRPVLPGHGLQHLRLRLLHRPEQRPSLRRHRLLADLAFPGGGHLPSAPLPGAGRHLVGGDSGGTADPCHYRRLPPHPENALWLRQCGGGVSAVSPFPPYRPQ